MECPDINEYEKIGPIIFRQFDDKPGENFLDKGLYFGKRGAYLGGLTGGFSAAIFEPAAHVNGFLYGCRTVAAGALIGGTALTVLGVGIPVAQAIRGKNDPIAWGMGGFAAGTIFGVRSGKLGFALKMGGLLAVLMSTIKVTGAYVTPYTDSFKHVREGKPPQLHKLFDEEGNLITYRQF